MLDRTKSGVGRIKQVFLYVLAVFILLAGMGGMLGGGWGFLGGLILIVTALFLMPATRSRMTRAIASVNGPDLSTLGRGTFAVLIIVGLVAGGALLPPAESPSDIEGTDSAPSPSNSTATPSSASEQSSNDTSASTSGPSSADASQSDSGPSSDETSDATPDSTAEPTSDETSDSTSDSSSETPVSNSEPSTDDTSDASDSASESTSDTATSTSEPTSDDTSTSSAGPSSDGASTSDSSTTSTDSSQQTSWTVTVISVTDGDTMEVRMPDGSTDTIRLLGVDTPETSAGDTQPSEWEGIPDNADGREWLANWGGQASDYAEDRLAGQEIHIEVDPESDRRGTYDRLLVYAYQSESTEKSFNLRLIENGYARMYDTQFSQRSEYQAAESEARDNDVGVWDYTAPSTSPPPSGGSGGGQDADVVVSTIHADASGNDHENLNEEYIELTNEGGSTVDMTGWTLSDEANHVYTFPSGFTLEPGDTVTIYTGSGSNSESELYWGSGAAVWNNTGDTIIVANDDGETVIEREYSE